MERGARRALLLVLINQVLENPAWGIGYAFQLDSPFPDAVLPGGGGDPFFLTGVITALGLTLAVGGALLSLGSVVWLALGVAGLWITNTLTPDPSHVATLYDPIVRLLLIPGHTGVVMVIYPLIPWFAIAAFGVAFGLWLQRDERGAYRAAPWIGLALVAAALALRAIGGFGNLRLPRDGSWIEFLNFVKYPPALVLSAFMVGGNLLSLGWFAGTSRRLGRLSETLAVFGRTPLFFYIAHLWLFAILGALFFRHAAGLQVLYAVWLVGLVPLWFLCQRYRAFKERKPTESIWRLF